MAKVKNLIAEALKEQYPNAGSHGEETLLWIIRNVMPDIQEPEREVQIFVERGWRYDFVWREAMIIVEVEGGAMSGGRHVRGQGFTEDARKYNMATARGWRVIRFTTEMVDNGEALATLEYIFKGALTPFP